MSTSFQAEQSRFFAPPQAPDATWLKLIRELTSVQGALVLDMNCGNGMYAGALSDLGAMYVIGVDGSDVLLKAARATYPDTRRLDFVHGSALSTGLIAERYDFVLQRGLLSQLNADDIHRSLVESYRLLKPGGTLVLQEQTLEDCLAPGSKEHIRGYFFSRYPGLIDSQTLSQLRSELVQQELQRVGFHDIQQRKLWETRGTYADLNALAQELVTHAASTPLHQSSDEELRELVSYVSYIEEHLPGEEGQQIVEQDCWTIWKALKN